MLVHQTQVMTLLPVFDNAARTEAAAAAAVVVPPLICSKACLIFKGQC